MTAFRNKVSVIVPLYNSETFLGEALDSIFQQSFQDFEIVAVDDGSTDGSRGIVEQYQDRYPGRITYVYQDNKGIAGARNTGIRTSAGEYLALLDADDRWYPARLAEGVAVLDGNPQVGLVHARRDRIVDGQTVPEPVRHAARYQSGRIFENLVLRRASIGALTVLFRRTCCDAVGFFDEDRKLMGVDDREFWQRLALQYQVFFIDKVLASWRCHEGNYSKKLNSMASGRFFVLDKLRSENKISSLLYRKAAARIYKEMADVYLGCDTLQARDHYLASLKEWPLELFSFVNLIKTFLSTSRCPRV